MTKTAKTLFFLFCLMIFFNLAYFEGARVMASSPLATFVKVSANK